MMMGETGLLGFRIANIEQGAGLYFIYNLTLLFFSYVCLIFSLNDSFDAVTNVYL